MPSDILLITDCGYPWTVGGVSTWIADLVRGLPDRRFTMLGLRFDGAERRLSPLLPAGMRFVDVRSTPPVSEAEAVRLALDAARDFEPAVIHASSTGIAGRVALALSRATGAPLVITEHGLAWRDAEAETLYTPVQSRLRPAHASVHFLHPDRHAAAHEIFAHAAAVTSVSHANAQLQRPLVPADRSVQVIANGVEPLAEPGRTSDQNTVVFAGRIAPEKGADRFVRSAALLAARHPELRFELRGPIDDVVYARACVRLAARLGLDAERLAFTGAVPRTRLFEGAALLLLPSRLEACPYALLEAMAAGVPAVVAAEAGDCAGIVGETGLAVRGDEVAFAQAVETLLEDDVRRAAGRLAHERAARFSRERMLDAYRAVYARVERRSGSVRPARPGRDGPRRSVAGLEAGVRSA